MERVDDDLGWNSGELTIEVAPPHLPANRIWGHVKSEIPDGCELCIYTYGHVREVRGYHTPQPHVLARRYMRVAHALRRYDLRDDEYGIPMDSGGWFLWRGIQKGEETASM